MRPVDGLELAWESSEVEQVVLSAEIHSGPLGEFLPQIVNMKATMRGQSQRKSGLLLTHVWLRNQNSNHPNMFIGHMGQRKRERDTSKQQLDISMNFGFLATCMTMSGRDHAVPSSQNAGVDQHFLQASLCGPPDILLSRRG